MNVFQIAGHIYRGMSAFQEAAAEGLDPVIAQLVKIRASQLNKCAFCLDMHLNEARQQGETQVRLDLVGAWEEAGDLYTERERAALELAEAITLLSERGVSDELFDRAAEHFEEKELAQLIAQITAINAWNRLAVTTRAVPMSLSKGAGQG